MLDISGIAGDDEPAHTAKVMAKMIGADTIEPVLDVDRMAKAFVAIRDARSALAEEFKTNDAALKAKQTMLEGVMLRHLQTQNANSVATDHGTIYRQEELTPTGADWDAFYKHIKKTGEFDLFQRREQFRGGGDQAGVGEADLTIVFAVIRI